MNKKNRDKVLVLIVDHNTDELIPGVLQAINEDGVDVSILLVANASSEESYRQLQKITDQRMRLVRSKDNLGFTGGNNFGLKYALENIDDFKYVFLLNPDAYITPNLIANLKEILDANENAACVSPKIFAKNGQTWYGGSNIDFKKGRVTTSIDVDLENVQLFYKVDVFNGCAVLFRTDRFMEAGMLNEELFMYYEEADCSLKLRKLGYDILYAPQFTVMHDVSYSTRSFSHVKTYYMTRNKFMVFNETMTLYSKLYFLAHEFAYNIKHKRYKNALYLLRGYIDFKKGKTGKAVFAR